MHHSCPRCGRTVDKSFRANWVPLNKCNSCGTRYCHGPKCSGGKDVCPQCGSTAHSRIDKTYAK